LQKRKQGPRNSSIKNPSLQSGFEDVNHFIRLFKQSEGMAPGVYRNKLIA